MRWLRRHSGVEAHGSHCRRHRPVSEMTDLETLAAMEGELKLRCSRAWLIDLCNALEIPRRGRPGPPALPSAERRAKNNHRWNRWISDLKANEPEKYRAYLSRKNDAAAVRRTGVPA